MRIRFSAGTAASESPLFSIFALLANHRRSVNTGYPSHSGRLNTLWMGGLGIFKEIAWSAPLGPWGASAVSGGEIDAKRALCSCVALASQWRLLIARPKRPLFFPVSGAHHHMLGLPESDGYPVFPNRLNTWGCWVCKRDGSDHITPTYAFLGDNILR